MENSKVVYEGQQFVKVNPIDITKEIEDALNELPKLKRDIKKLKERLNKKEFISEEDKRKFQEDYEYMLNVEEITKMPPYNTYGMDRFWTLSLQENCYVLVSNRNSKGDDIIATRFFSISGLYKQFRSVSDIIENEPFIGKRIISKNPSNEPLYGLYELDNVILVCTANEKMKIKKVYPGVKSFRGPVQYAGAPNNELKDNGRILRLVYKQKI